MPIFEFECPDGHTTEALVKSNVEEVRCKKCKQTARKIMSASSFSLKGHGWAGDGYAVERNRPVKLDEPPKDYS